MAVNITKPAVNLREELARLNGVATPSRRATFDHEFNGSDPSVVLPNGWKPFAVYLNGTRQREGANNDYSASFDGFVWTVTFEVTPSNISVAIIDAEQRL